MDSAFISSFASSDYRCLLFPFVLFSLCFLFSIKFSIHPPTHHFHTFIYTDAHTDRSVQRDSFPQTAVKVSNNLPTSFQGG